ncbi:cell cycle protein, FtsW/RodA/SpoVE family [Aedoeadaptatus nemausensis]|uniref:Cell cycle protein, FtsW/RodA/SpoVE family n=1 Tax=Aedoeadaptatus nemausensis TaxID=2582829 RepID=A0A6V6XZL1_9FIRM|nr:FtsW/RodA/SpoVE family cell cycle protein [Peptoniphilus nemausensis]CAC9924797.1 cell cycle protein, FtsW/RodA/SpoVE family [Peptoniphilus nemausensis]
MINKLLRRPRDILLIFEVLAILLVFYTYEGDLDRQLLFLTGGLVFVIYISNFILGKITTGDNYIFLIISLLLTIGVVTIFRIKPETGIKQLQWAFIGVLLFYATYFVVRVFPNLERYGSLALIISVLLFLSTLIFGKTVGGSRNWLSLGFIVFQPTEFIKILLMFILGSFYTNYEKYRRYPYASYIIMAIIYFFVLLLFIQRDLGTAVMFMAMYMSVQFIYDPDIKAKLINIALLLLGAIAGYFLFSHVRTRFDIWLNPWNDVYNAGRQIVQSLFAIAEGGFFGAGIGFGHPELIPVSESDFIFPVICEEMGLFAGFAIILLYILLIYRGIKIALEQEYKFYRILAITATVMISIQAFLNIGGVTKFIPMTGITLPFMSYGGSSILSSFIALGILQVASEDLTWKYERDGKHEVNDEEIRA